MKISVYLKKYSTTTSNICFRVREKNVDIKVVSPIAVHDKYWDADTLCYRRTTAVTAIEQKRACPSRLPPSSRERKRPSLRRLTASG